MYITDLSMNIHDCYSHKNSDGAQQDLQTTYAPRDGVLDRESSIHICVELNVLNEKSMSELRPCLWPDQN